ncbi:alpha/beta hydrolase [Hypericibacter adhaerens]|uniref:Alpha/beta hydrolase n=2 Tax=Hypericibacter adhaerens TaxID=2602016 RepID=A0A5J6N650_9PROT|nr:alpha/beta hydrolase [Hypericibacter adhaerens]QEX24163.1 alpha/beta hydrolase [Hypericibacter adhaerens]
MKKILALVLGAAFALVAGFVAPATVSAKTELWQTLPRPAPMPQALKSGTAPIDGVQIYYAIYGHGAPLILLHGGLGNADYWGNQVREFAKHYQVIVMDSRGHGRSTRDAQPYGYHLMATDVVHLMDYLKIDRASIVGWSDGGIIGLDIAMTYPDRLDKLFAFGANVTTSGLREDIGQSTVFNKYIEEAGKDYARLSKTPKEYDAFVQQISEMWNMQPNYSAEQLASIKAPVVIADGQHDEGIKQSHDIEMAKEIPGARLLIFPGLSHFAMWQDPKTFNKAVLQFLAE